MVSYCILCEWIKGYNSSITTIMCQRGRYRTVVGMLEYLQNSSTTDIFLSKKVFVYSLNVLNCKECLLLAHTYLSLLIYMKVYSS